MAQGANWAVAVAASIALHAAVLGFVWWSGGEAASGEVAGPAEPAATGETGEPAATVETASPAAPAPSAAPVGAVEPSNRPTPASPAAPVSSASSPSSTSAVAPAAPAAPAAGDSPFYVVKQGDRFIAIAKKHGMTPEELARINGKPLKKFDVIWVGQKIRIRE